MATVVGAGVELAVVERGKGPGVLVVHGIGADAAAMSSTVDALVDVARVVAYDRRGYGDSGAPEPYGATTVEEQAEDAIAVLRAGELAPAVVVGDGFGALVALDLVRRHRPAVAGVVLREPPLFAFVPEAAEVLSSERALLEERLREAGPEAAVDAWPALRGTAADRARARAAHRAFFADLVGVSTWSVTRRELRAIDVPVAVVTAAGAPPHVVAAADAVAALAPAARRSSDGDLAAATRGVLAAR